MVSKLIDVELIQVFSFHLFKIKKVMFSVFAVPKLISVFVEKFGFVLNCEERESIFLHYLFIFASNKHKISFFLAFVENEEFLNAYDENTCKHYA